jgi:Na+-driven multidrug efflux pump
MKDQENPIASIDLWKLTVPLFIQILLVLGLDFTDTYFISRRSDLAAAGIGGMLPCILLAIVALQIVGQVGSTIASQLIGAKKFYLVYPTYFFTVLFGGTVGLGFSLIFRFYGAELAQYIRLEGEPYVYATVYI